jgi:hypothetical protein
MLLGFVPQKKAPLTPQPLSQLPHRTLISLHAPRKQRIQLVLQMDAGKMELKAAEFNLWGCIDFCMEMLVLRCENKGLYLSYSMDESVPE